MVAQLRAGRCPITAEYRHRCGWEETPACACGSAVESVAHLVLSCPRYEKERQRLLHWPGERSLTVLAREPARVMAFLREIGREGCAAKAPQPAPKPEPAAAKLARAAHSTTRSEEGVGAPFQHVG